MDRRESKISNRKSEIPDCAILLTPPGSAAIAVVRLCGPKAGEFLCSRFSKPAAAGRCVHGELRDGDRVIDDAVVVLDPAGRFADMSIHGGLWVVRAVLEMARREGFSVVERPALPLPDAALEGESIIEREIAAYLPLARTELAIRVLLAQEEAWRFGLLVCRTPLRPPRPLYSAGEGGGEGDREYQPLSTADRPHPNPLPRGTAGEGTGSEEILADWSLYWLLHLPHVAIVGAANVGKSTLANQLFAQERSITADLPGTTRDWVGEIANIDGLAVMLVDTPGLRESGDSTEQAAIATSAPQIERADAIVLVLDASMALAEQQALLGRYPDAIRVVNKTDRPATWDWSLAGPDAIKLVATTGENVAALRIAICRRFGCADMEIGRPRWWTPRHRALLTVGQASSLSET